MYLTETQFTLLQLDGLGCTAVATKIPKLLFKLLL